MPTFRGFSTRSSRSDPATALNPFTSGAPGSPQLLSALVGSTAGTADSQIDGQLIDGQAILRGPVVNMPAGAVQAVIGAEWSQEKQETTFLNPGVAPSIRSLRRNTYSVFSEARVPILAVAINRRTPSD